MWVLIFDIFLSNILNTKFSILVMIPLQANYLVYRVHDSPSYQLSYCASSDSIADANNHTAFAVFSRLQRGRDFLISEAENIYEHFLLGALKYGTLRR